MEHTVKGKKAASNKTVSQKKGTGSKSLAKEPVKDGNKVVKKRNLLFLFERLRILRQFLKETYLEFQKITWPERTQVIRETCSVIFLVTVITLMVLAFDFAVAKVIFEPLDRMARQAGGGVGILGK